MTVQGKSRFPSSPSYGTSSCYIASSPTPKANTWLAVIHERLDTLLGEAFHG